MKRMGMVINILPDKIKEYKELHANAWPEILARITACNIKNYSIFLREPENILFGYWEYHGTDFAADMEEMKKDEATKRWWAVCDPCVKPMDSCKEGEKWAMMEEVFHLD